MLKFDSPNITGIDIIIMVVLCSLVYIIGYPAFAVVLFLAMFGAMMFGQMEARGHATPQGSGWKNVGGIKVKGAEVMDPIIIETSRAAPYRIPANMEIRVKPNWSGIARWEKAVSWGMGRPLRSLTRYGYESGMLET